MRNAYITMESPFNTPDTLKELKFRRVGGLPMDMVEAALLVMVRGVMKQLDHATVADQAMMTAETWSACQVGYITKEKLAPAFEILYKNILLQQNALLNINHNPDDLNITTEFTPDGDILIRIIKPYEM